MDQPDAPDPTVPRRSVLLGGAATAAVAGVAAVARPAGAAAALPYAEQLAASPVAPQALAGAGLVNAVDVDLVPAGELTATNVQDALYDLDGRLSKMRPIDDLRSIPSVRLGSLTLIDDFMGNTSATGTIGSLGWATAAGATGIVAPRSVLSAPGVTEIGTGGIAAGWMAINLGTQNLFGCPAFVQETRFKLENVNSTNEKASVFVGLTGIYRDATTFEPNLGCYFRYGPINPNSNWWAVCAQAGLRTAVDTGVPGDTAWHRFRATSDGPTAPGPGVRFSVDGVHVPASSPAVVTTNLPDLPLVGCAPTIEIRKTNGSAARTLWVDYYALRWAVTR